MALFTNHAKRMRLVIPSSVACPAVTHFHALSKKHHDFMNMLLNTKCILIFSTTFV